MRDLTKSFSIDYLSEEDDRRYMGTFTCKKLTIRGLSQLGYRKAELCGGHSYNPETGKGIDPGTAFLNEMIAHCEIDPENMTDLGLLNEVYKEVADFEANFRGGKPETQRSGSDSSVQASSSVESSGGGRTTHSIEDVVDKKIPKISPLS